MYVLVIVNTTERRFTSDSREKKIGLLFFPLTLFPRLSPSESEVEPAQVFLSYQWDIQDEVRTLRNKLEAAGFTCWMDIGQMGGGDQLYGKIDAAIRGCKVRSLLVVFLQTSF